MAANRNTETSAKSQDLHRSIDWRGAFWVASGVPALVLFSIGGIAAIAGKVAFLVWAVSMLMGFIQSFTYAEIAGLYPNKSGGASIYGASAWVRYSKFVAPLSVWCNWLAWTPVLSLGCSIAAVYILNAYFPTPMVNSPEVLHWLNLHASELTGDAAANSAAALSALTPAVRSWSLFAFPLGPVTFTINANFVIGAVLMLIVFAIQHRGILGTANFQKWIGLFVIAVLVLIGVVPVLLGNVDFANFSNIVPLAQPAAAAAGEWNIGGWTLVLGALFIAAWSTYAFETAICYTSEFKNPATDTYKAIFYSGLLCLALFILVPFTFQGFLGVEGMIAPSVLDNSGIADILASMVGGGSLVHAGLVIAIILALLLSIMTAMAGSSRTLYQGSRDGWLPKYLDKVNDHGAPTRAMWTDLVFNLNILSAASASDGGVGFFFILAISNTGYIIFNFLNLNAGWIHRVDSPNAPRPYRAATILMVLGTGLSFVNAMLLGAGAKVWNPIALWAGIVAAALILPVFIYRHYIQDGGVFPHQDETNLGTTERRAGILPYVVLVAGVAVVLLSNWFFTMPTAP
ncbi:MAG: APC family permease [Alphaproteobacteria bacterium]|nr:APC family permease [Alphaproteobacteria bacterium]